MKDGLLMRFGAAVLALLTLAAMVFALLNFQQSSRFVAPEDGITWIDGSQGVVAWYVAPDSPGARAGIRERSGFFLIAIEDGQRKSALQQLPGHAATHQAETEKSDAGFVHSIT